MACGLGGMRICRLDMLFHMAGRKALSSWAAALVVDGVVCVCEMSVSVALTRGKMPSSSAKAWGEEVADDDSGRCSTMTCVSS